MTSKIKVYELAKELAVDSQHLVDIIQRLGIDIKNTMSVLGTEEVRTVREYYQKNRPVAKSVAQTVGASRAPVTEKRVGATVIRRRAVDKKDDGAATTSAPSAAFTSPPAQTMATAPTQAASSTVSSPAAEKEAEEFKEPTFSDELELTSLAPSESESEAEVQSQPAVPNEPKVVPSAAEEKREKAAPQASPSAAASESRQEAAPVAPAPAANPAPRRIYPSIIKKMSTEQHLGQVVGPKVEKKEKPKEALAPAPAKPKSTQPAATAAAAGGPKRVKEVDLAGAATEVAARDVGKRRVMQRQDSVFRSTDYLKRELVHATKKKKNAIARPALKTQITQAAAHKRVVEMGNAISVADIAKGMGVKASVVVAKLMGMGVTATVNQPLDVDTASLVAHEFGYEVRQEVFKEQDFVPALEMDAEKLEPRAPVVTIMGHVDHGKTSLLDAIRKTNVAAGEAGGITQHVGAYTVQVPKGKVTFIDTPGHEAFTAMRARGAKVTDIVVVVVSAVDGVMPQTLESIAHAKAAGVPIIVAINKVDLPDGNPDRIKQTLAGHELTPEEWGGDTIYVSVSAKTGQGLDKLLESILLQAELLELKANYQTPARGSVIESRLDKNRGPVASVLVQHGKLEPGQIVVCGTTFGKIRAMSNSFGQKMDAALPSDPVEILGLSDVPVVGDDFFVAKDEKTAKEVTTARLEAKKEKAQERPKLSLEAMMAQPVTEKELRVVLKADVVGSVEALKEALSKFPTDKAKLKILHAATGGVVESDVMLASASGAVVLGFNVRPDMKAAKLAETEHVQVRTYNIIYDLLEDTRKLLEGLLDATVKERVIGRAEVREIFNVPRVGVIAGSAVIDGKVTRGCYLRLLRDSRVIYEGRLSSLRRFKEDVKEVSSGFECGIGLENFNDLKLGDQFEAFLKEEIKGVL